MVALVALLAAAGLALAPRSVAIGDVDLAPTVSAAADGPTARAPATAPPSRRVAPARATGSTDRVERPPTNSPSHLPTPDNPPAISPVSSTPAVADERPTNDESISAPVHLDVPTLGLDVPVVAVGQDADGRMAVPEDVNDAGWYRHGPAPGGAGNAVIAGHVDDREQGLGAFHELVDLAVGDAVVVTADDGTTTSWEVTGRELIDKSALDVQALFRRTGPTQLVLITCGGEFDRTGRSYRANVVVVASPVAG